ncbi:helix-turn-helix domain-containing protein [Zoogloea sp. LCSB751]|uniref:helix-turn-helix domain-containing protein n=1 Tax=Zoogloea sp. LCSB751 TaxID=1965277 RepID=UPI001C1FFA72|nr:helix-turn-helix transcriptional regulator [Zoogloea sp. LCSB751]
MLVQKLRLQRGWSQQQLAELSGLSARTIQRIEGGQTASAEAFGKATVSIWRAT